MESVEQKFREEAIEYKILQEDSGIEEPVALRMWVSLC